MLKPNPQVMEALKDECAASSDANEPSVPSTAKPITLRKRQSPLSLKSVFRAFRAVIRKTKRKIKYHIRTKASPPQNPMRSPLCKITQPFRNLQEREVRVMSMNSPKSGQLFQTLQIAVRCALVASKSFLVTISRSPSHGSLEWHSVCVRKCRLGPFIGP